MDSENTTMNEIEALKQQIAEKDDLLNESMASMDTALKTMKALQAQNTELQSSLHEQQNTLNAFQNEVVFSRGILGRVQLYIDHFDDLVQVYGLLSDEKSREVFLYRALWWLSTDWDKQRELIYRIKEPCETVSTEMVSFDKNRNRIPVMVDENQYYPEGLFELGENEAYLDVGAYNGDTVLQFIEKTGDRYNAIYALEPSKRNYAQCRQNLQSKLDGRIHLFNYGLSDREETLYFTTNQDPGACGAQEAAEGKDACEMKPIEHILSAQQLKDISFIKMDVEGDEMKSLKTLTPTITKNKPKMAISIYHKQEDMYELPLYVHSLVPDYRFYLRHHTDIFGDTVLYAIPE